MESLEIEYPDTQFRVGKPLKSDSEQQDRNGFIKKVYGIVLSQLLFTSLMTCLPLFFPIVESFMQHNPSLLVLLSILAIVIELVILCKKDLARTVPTNYILLAGFTFCEGYIVACGASAYDTQSVCMAAFMTAGVTAGLTFYAWTTKEDFTMMRGLLSVFGSALLLLVIMIIIFQSEALMTLYCFFIVIIMGIYLIVDTQFIIGEKRYEINDDDYILGAMIIYLDIIMLFVYILRIMGQHKK